MQRCRRTFEQSSRIFAGTRIAHAPHASTAAAGRALLELGAQTRGARRNAAVARADGAQVGLSVWGNYWNRALFDALEQRSVAGVLIQIGVFALIFVVSIAVTAAHLLVKRWLQRDWRAWLTDRLIGRWMENGRHYRLLFSRGEHDNPDQRIAEDIRLATEGAVTLAHSLTFALLNIGSFVGILWSVSGTITMPGTHMEVPGYLVPLAFLYAGVGTLLGWMLGRPLVRSTNALQTAEANFRFGLSRAREHSEAIALMHGEPIERSGAASALQAGAARLRSSVAGLSRHRLVLERLWRVAAGFSAAGRSAAVHHGCDVARRPDAGRAGVSAADLGVVVAGEQHRRNRALPNVGRTRAVAVRRHGTARRAGTRTGRASHRASNTAPTGA